MSSPRRTRRTYIQGDYGQVHLWFAEPETPTAVPIMCFHASPLSGRVFEFFLDEMGEDRLALAPDTPGYGQSDPPPQPIDIPGYGTAMANLLEALGIKQVDLIGYADGLIYRRCTRAAMPRRRTPPSARRRAHFGGH